MLPDVHGEDGGLAPDDGVLRVGRLCDGQLAAVHHQPRPAGAELRRPRRAELLFEVLHAAEGALDRLLQLALQLWPARIDGSACGAIYQRNIMVDMPV